MNANKKLLRDEKFRDIEKTIKTVEHMRKYVIKTQCGVFRIKNFPMFMIPPELRAKFEAITPAKGWQLKALKVIADTEYAHFDPYIPRDNPRNLVGGIASGMAVANAEGFNEICADPIGKAAILPLFGAMTGDGLAADDVIEKRFEEYKKGNQKRAMDALNAPQAKQAEYFEGHKRGIEMFDGKIPKSKRAIHFVCSWLLLLDDQVKRFTGKKELYAFLRGEGKPAAYGSFIKICQRLSFDI